MNTKYKSSADEDSEMQAEYLLGYKRSLSINNLSVSIDEPIREPKYYRAIAEEITNLGQHDTVQFRVNSPGGRLDGLVVLLNAIENTEADVVCFIEGECHSAASIFALHCPNIIISPYASMMVHHVSYGTAGKDSDVVSMVMHNTAYCKELFMDTYKYFLSDQEIQDVLNGKEIWLRANDIKERLERRAEALSKEETEDELQFPILEEPGVKPKRSKKTP
jgi:ATP-dependent protease ClpP protease subunit